MLEKENRSKHPIRVAGWILIGLMSASWASANAPSPEAEPERKPPPSAGRFKRGSMHGALLVGYGIGFRMGSESNRELSRELAGVRLMEYIPRFGIGITNPLAVGARYSGNLEALVEGAFFHNTAQNGSVGGGVGTTLRYNFLFNDRIIPYLDANFGLIGIGLKLERQSDRFNFNVGFGGGIHFLVSDRVAISTEFRWQHISNAKTELPNDGINTALFLVGVSFFLD
jgi:opacity protein-like surface antigen